MTDRYCLAPHGHASASEAASLVVELGKQKRPRQCVNTVIRSLTALGAAMSKDTSPPSLTDQKIMDTLEKRPDWLPWSVLRYLDGYPSSDDCWLWQRSQSAPWGYGRVDLPAEVGYGTAYVHRVMWIALRGSIPPGFVIDHDGDDDCGNKACANPAHVSAVPHRHNVAVTGGSASALNARKTHCPRGHLLAGDNLVASVIKRGGRNCLKCDKLRHLHISAAAKHLGMSRRAYIRAYGSSRMRALSFVDGGVDA